MLGALSALFIATGGGQHDDAWRALVCTLGPRVRPFFVSTTALFGEGAIQLSVFAS